MVHKDLKSEIEELNLKCTAYTMLKDVAGLVNLEIFKLIKHQKMAVAMKELSALINAQILIGDHL